MISNSNHLRTTQNRNRNQNPIQSELRTFLVIPLKKKKLKFKFIGWQLLLMIGLNLNFRPNNPASSGNTNDELSQIIDRTKKKPLNYYNVLGVKSDVDARGIRVAYMKLSLKVHPDKCQDKDKIRAEEAFKVVAAAKECLENPKTRKRYDIVGVDGCKTTVQL